MASYIDTELSKAITKANNTLFADTEMFELDHGTLKTFRKNEPRVFANAEQLKQSTQQPTEAIMFTRDYKASGDYTAVTADHGGQTLGGSMVKSITYTALEQHFEVSHKAAENNMYSYEEMVRNGLKQAWMNLHRDENSMLIDWLALNKSQVANGNTLLQWNATDNVYENQLSDLDSMALNLKATMRANKYYGAYDVVCDQYLFRNFEKAGFNGRQNAQNTATQLQGLTPVEDIELVNAGYNGFGYAFLKGTVGMSSWIGPKYIKGDGKITGNAGMYSMLFDPVYNIPTALHVKQIGADTQDTSLNGDRQDTVDRFQLFRFNTIGASYFSEPNKTAVLAFGQKAV